MSTVCRSNQRGAGAWRWAVAICFAMLFAVGSSERVFYNLGIDGSSRVTSFMDGNVVKLNGATVATLAQGQAQILVGTRSGDIVATSKEAQVTSVDAPLRPWAPARYAATAFALPTPRGTEHSITVMPTCAPIGSVTLPDEPFRVDSDGRGTTVTVAGSVSAPSVSPQAGGATPVAGPGTSSNFLEGLSFAAGQRFHFGSTGLAVGPAFTIDAWIRAPLPAAGPAFRVLVHGPMNGAHIAAQSQAGGKYVLGVLDEASTGFHSSGIDVNALSAGWHRVTVVGTSNLGAPLTLFYVDGGTLGGGSQGDTAFRLAEPVFAFGSWTGATVGEWGVAARLRVYPEQALSADQVALLSTKDTTHVIADANSTAVALTGTWTSVTSGTAFGSDYLTESAAGAATARFSVPLAAKGSYEVFSWHPSDGTATTVAAFSIQHAAGAQAVTVNQRVASGRWNRLARLNFEAGVATVTLTAPGGSRTNADAVRFIRVSDQACASVTLRKGTTDVASQLLYPGSAYTFPRSVTTTFNAQDTAAILAASAPIVVAAISHLDATCGASHDGRLAAPAHQEIVGIASRTAYIHALEAGTTVRIYSQHGLVATESLSPGVSLPVTGLPASFGPTSDFPTPGLPAYDGTALRLVANKPIAALSIDDGDGCSATSFTPPYLMSREFMVPNTAEAVSFVAVPRSSAVDTRVTTEVPEPGEWSLVHDLQISPTTSWVTIADIPYTFTNFSASYCREEPRVGYLMTLKEVGGVSGANQYIWTSMDLFTNNLTELGVPIQWKYDIPVTRLTVRTNRADIPQVTEAESGKIEFWPNCMLGFGGDESKFDHDDQPIGEVAPCYGSMQVHRGTNTLWAFNRWAGFGADLGIGNNPNAAGNPDWTDENNVATLANVRNLKVYLRSSCPQEQSFQTTAPGGGATTAVAVHRFSPNTQSPSIARVPGFSVTGGTVATGTYYKASFPMFAVFEDKATNDETLLLGWGQLAGLLTNITTAQVVEGDVVPYTVSLPTQPFANVTVHLTETSTDIDVSPRALFFTPDTWNTPQLVTVVAVDDTVDEDNFIVSTITHSVSSLDQGYASAENVTVAITVVDNEDIAGPPSNLRVVTATGGLLSVAWGVPAFQGSAPILRYQLEIRTAGPPAGPWMILSRNADNSSVLDSPSVLTFAAGGLEPSSGYDFRVAALTSVGLGAYTSPLSAFTAGVSAPGAPQPPTQTGRTGGSVSLSWRPPLDSGGTAIRGYRVFVDGTEVAAVTTTTFSPVGLSPFSDYAVQIAAVNEVLFCVGVGTRSNATIASTGRPSPPDAVQPLPTAVNATGGAVTLTWGTPRDKGGVAVSGYRVFMCPGNATAATCTPAEVRSGFGDATQKETLFGLTASTAHAVQVAALTFLTATDRAATLPVSGDAVSVTFGNTGSRWGGAAGATVELWFAASPGSPPSSLANAALLSTATDATATPADAVSLTLDASLHVVLRWIVAGAAPASLRSSAPLAEGLSNGRWTHVAAVWRTGQVTLYVDGFAAGNATALPPRDVTWAGFSLGGRPYPGALPNTALSVPLQVDELRLWDGSRSLSQMRAAISGPLAPGDRTDLAMYIPFDTAPQGSRTAPVEGAKAIAAGATASLASSSSGATVVDSIRSVGVRSAVVLATTTPPTPPGAPTAVTVVETRGGSATLRWTPPRDTGGVPVSNYTILRDAGQEGSQAGAGAINTVAAFGVVSNATVFRLTANHTYRFVVRATGAAGTGPASLAVSGTTTAPTPPSAVPAPVAPPLSPCALTTGVVDPPCNPSGGAINAAWGEPVDFGGVPVLAYQSALAPALPAAFASPVDTAAARSVDFRGLSPTTAYRIRARAGNAAGWGEWSEVLDVTTAAASKPSAPGAPVLASRTGGSVSLTWTAPLDVGGTPLRGYSTFAVASPSTPAGACASPDGTTCALVVDGGTNTAASAVVNGLRNNTVYHFRVIALNAVSEANGGAGTLGAVSSIETGNATAPGAMAAPVRVNETLTSFAVRWAAPPDTGGLGPGALLYELEIKNDTVGVFQRAYAGPHTEADLQNLVPGATYTVRVRASSSIGAGPVSPETAVTLSDSVQPRPPLLGCLAATFVQVTWVDPVIVQGVTYTGFRLLTRPATGGALTLRATASATARQATLTGLPAGTELDVFLQATNSTGGVAGAGPVSDPLRVETTASDAVVVCRGVSGTVDTGPYAAGADVQYQLRPRGVWEAVRVTVTRFDLECDFDAVQVSSIPAGADVAAASAASALATGQIFHGGCFRRGPFTLVGAAGQNVSVRLTSDGSTQAGGLAFAFSIVPTGQAVPTSDVPPCPVSPGTGAVCSGRGASALCPDARCACTTGWTGEDCSARVLCPDVLPAALCADPGRAVLVSANGSDAAGTGSLGSPVSGRNGTVGKPLASLGRALAVRTAGQQIVLLPGLYAAPANHNLTVLASSGAVSIRGVGAREETVLDCRGGGRLLTASPGAVVSLSALTVRQPAAAGATAGGGAVVVSAGANVTVTDVEVVGASAGGDGGAFLVAAGASLTLRDSAVSGASAGGDGGAFFVAAGASLTLSNTTVSGASAGGTNGGGCILFGGGAGALSAQATTLASCNATQGDGGALWLGPAAAVTASGSVIRGAAARRGGAVAMQSGTLLATPAGGLAVESAAATDGGAGLFITGAGTGSRRRLLTSAVATTVTGLSLTGLSAPRGGGVLLASGASAELVGCTVRGNSATGPLGGGGVHASGASVVLGAGTVVAGNNATAGDGGSVWIADGTLTVRAAAALSGGTAHGSGGCAHAEGDAATLVLEAGTVVSGGVAGGRRGGVAGAGGGGCLSVARATPSTAAAHLSVGAGASVRQCSASGGNGGAVFLLGARGDAGPQTLFEGNDASQRGGAVFATGGAEWRGPPAAGGATGGAVYRGNTASGGGGGALAANGTGTVVGVAAGDACVGNSAPAGAGGCLLVETGASAAVAGNVTENRAGAGGGGGLAARGADSSASVAATAFVSANVVATGSGGSGGGVLAVLGAAVTIVGGGAEVSGNVAAGGGGGGVCAVGPGSVVRVFAGTAMRGNTAATGRGGGAAAVDGGSVSLTGATLAGNTATDGGGAASAGTGSSLTVVGGSASGNAASVRGGALFVTGASASAVATDWAATDNRATGDGGAVAMVSGGAGTLTRCALTGNTAGGSGGAAALDTEAALTLGEGCTLAGNTAAGGGGGVSVSRAAAVRASVGVVVRGNSAGTGGGLAVSGANSSASLGGGAGCVLEGNSATVGGGGLHASQRAEITLAAGAVLANNSAAAAGGGGGSGAALVHGGGAFVDDAALVAPGVTARGNTAAAAGGAVYARRGASVRLDGATVIGNRASSGGGLFVTASALSAVGSAFSGNAATGTSGPSASDVAVRGGGGSVALVDGAAANLRDAAMSGDSAGEGGSLFVLGPTVALLDGAASLSASSAATAGGCAFVGTGASLTVASGTRLQSCRAQTGGCVAASGSGASFSLQSAALSQCTATGEGGALACVGGAACSLAPGSSLSGSTALYGGGVACVGSSTTLLANRSSMSGNTAAAAVPPPAGVAADASGRATQGLGGAVLADCGGGSGGASGVTLMQASAAGNSAQRGGWLYAASGAVSADGVAVANASATFRGGALYAASGVSVTLRGECTLVDARTISGDGGAVFAEGPITPSVVRLEGCRVEGGLAGGAGAGGGAHIASGATLWTRNGTVFSKCSSPGGSGGCVSVAGGAWHASGGSVHNCSAGRSGGGVSLSGGTWTADDVSVLDNTAMGGLGGAVFAESSSALRLTDALVKGTGKPSALNGGCMYLSDSTCTLERTTVSRCNATQDGGAIHASRRAFLTLKAVTVKTSGADSGGGLFVSEQATANASQSSVSNCHASVDGGGLHVEKSSVMWDDSDMTANAALASGGGAYLAAGASLTLSAANVTSNAAGVAGGGLYVGRDSRPVLGAVRFIDNVAEGEGGAVFCVLNTFSVSAGSLFERNRASDGGALFLRDTVATLSGATFERNLATGSGGAIACEAVASAASQLSLRRVRLVDCTISSNAASSGGAVSAAGSLELSLEGGRVSTNTAGSGGGLFVSDATRWTCSRSAVIADNAARAAGAGAYIAGDAHANVSSCSFTRNVAAGQGGGIYATHVLCPGSYAIVPGAVANVTLGSDLVQVGGLGQSLSPTLATFQAFRIAGIAVAVTLIEGTTLKLSTPWTSPSSVGASVATAPYAPCVSAADVSFTDNVAFAGAAVFWVYSWRLEGGTAQTFPCSRCSTSGNQCESAAHSAIDGIVTSPCTAASATTCTAVDGKDSYFFPAAKSKAACRAACTAAPSCAVFSFITPEARLGAGWAGSCYGRSSSRPVFAPTAGVTSGVVRDRTGALAACAFGTTTVRAAFGWFPAEGATVQPGQFVARDSALAFATQRSDVHLVAVDAYGGVARGDSESSCRLWRVCSTPGLVYDETTGGCSAAANVSASASGNDARVLRWTGEAGDAEGGYIPLDSLVVRADPETRYGVQANCTLENGLGETFVQEEGRNLTVGLCDAGFELTEDLACRVCPEGTYSPRGEVCLACPYASLQLGVVGATCSRALPFNGQILRVGTPSPSVEPGFWPGEARRALREEECTSSVLATWQQGTCPQGQELVDGGCRALSWSADRIFRCVTGVNFYRCPLGTLACANRTVGSAANASQVCLEGYRGTLCASCAEGFYSGSGGECARCQGEEGDRESIRLIYLVSFAVSMFVLLVAVAFYLRDDGPRRLKQTVQNCGRGCMQCLFCRCARSRKASIFNMPDIEKEQTVWFRPEKYKILLAFFQIFTQFRSNFEILWPREVEEAMRRLSFANLDVLKLVAFDCVLRTNFYDGFIFITFFPLVLAAILFIFFLVGRAMYNRRILKYPRIVIPDGMPGSPMRETKSRVQVLTPEQRRTLEDSDSDSDMDLPPSGEREFKSSGFGVESKARPSEPPQTPTGADPPTSQQAAAKGGDSVRGASAVNVGVSTPSPDDVSQRPALRRPSAVGDPSPESRRRASSLARGRRMSVTEIEQEARDAEARAAAFDEERAAAEEAQKRGERGATILLRQSSWRQLVKNVDLNAVRAEYKGGLFDLDVPLTTPDKLPTGGKWPLRWTRKMLVETSANHWKSRIRIKIQYRQYCNKCYRLFFWLLLLCYVSVSNRILRLYHCEEIGSKWFLTSDYSIECYDSRYVFYAALGGPLILLYVIGIPALFAYLLYDARKQNVDERVEFVTTGTAADRKLSLRAAKEYALTHDLNWRDPRTPEEEVAAIRLLMMRRNMQLHKTIDRLGFIYVNFREEVWWYEIWDFTRKLVCTAVIALVRPTSIGQVIVGMFVLLFYSYMLLYLKPYRVRSDAALANACLIVLFLVLFCGFLIKLDVAWITETGDDTETERQLLAWLVIIAIVAVIAIGIITIVWEKLESDLETKARTRREEEIYERKKMWEAMRAMRRGQEPGTHVPPDKLLSPRTGTLRMEASVKGSGIHSLRRTGGSGIHARLPTRGAMAMAAQGDASSPAPVHVGRNPAGSQLRSPARGSPLTRRNRVAPVSRTGTAKSGGETPKKVRMRGSVEDAFRPSTAKSRGWGQGYDVGKDRTNTASSRASSEDAVPKTPGTPGHA